MDLRTNSH